MHSRRGLLHVRGARIGRTRGKAGLRRGQALPGIPPRSSPPRGMQDAVEPLDGAGEMALDPACRKSEPPRDLAVGEMLNGAEEQDFPLDRPELREGAGKSFDIVAAVVAVHCGIRSFGAKVGGGEETGRQSVPARGRLQLRRIVGTACIIPLGSPCGHFSLGPVAAPGLRRGLEGGRPEDGRPEEGPQGDVRPLPPARGIGALRKAPPPPARRTGRPRRRRNHPKRVPASDRRSASPQGPRQAPIA